MFRQRRLTRSKARLRKIIGIASTVTLAVTYPNSELQNERESRRSHTNGTTVDAFTDIQVATRPNSMLPKNHLFSKPRTNGTTVAAFMGIQVATDPR